jgi:hypothetical protein
VLEVEGIVTAIASGSGHAAIRLTGDKADFTDAAELLDPQPADDRSIAREPKEVP